MVREVDNFLIRFKAWKAEVDKFAANAQVSSPEVILALRLLMTPTKEHYSLKDLVGWEEFS